MPLTGGDINKIPPGPGGSARLRAGACRHLHDHRRGTTARPGRPFLPHGICRILTRRKPCLLPAPPAWPPPPPCYPRRGQLPACPAAHRPWPAPGTSAPRTACRPPSLRHRATWPATRAPRSRSGRPQAWTGRTWRYRSGSCSAAAPGWRSRRYWARGAVVRRPGTVLAVTEAGQIIGFNPAGPLDRAIPDLAAHQRAEQAPPPADRKGRRRLHRPVRPDQPGRFTQPIVHPGLVMTSRRRARNAKVPGRSPAVVTRTDPP